MEEPFISSRQQKSQKSLCTGAIYATIGAALTAGSQLLSYGLTLLYQQSALKKHSDVQASLETCLASTIWRQHTSIPMLATLPAIIGVLYQDPISRDSLLFTFLIGIAVTFATAMLVNMALDSMQPCKPCKWPGRNRQRLFSLEEEIPYSALNNQEAPVELDSHKIYTL